MDRGCDIPTPMNVNLRRVITRQLQRIFWIYLTRNFLATSRSKLNNVSFPAQWKLLPISLENYSRVIEFRDEALVHEYWTKLNKGGIGLFAEVNGLVIGSIWATANLAERPTVVRAYMNLLPGEALVHDIFTGVKHRGIGVGSYMTYGMVGLLLNDKKVSRIIIDVNVNNRPSLRLMKKIGLQCSEKVLYVSCFGRLLFQRSLGRQ